MNKLICLVGMTGSGKSAIADMLIEKGYEFFRFGQITLDIVKERNLEPTEENERPIREEMRQKHGMGAYAILNMPKIDSLLEKGNVVGDGLYSWSEYKILKEKYKEQLIVIAVYAPPELRYQRLVNRKLKESDNALRNRPATKEQAKKRDYAEIENLEKGGPIAMADYTIINTGSMQELKISFDKIMKNFV
ncbi:MAG: AAA family ATPase [Candidatus Woesearchaeota archaeon]